MWKGSAAAALALAGLTVALAGDIRNARAQTMTMEELGSAVLQVKTHVSPDRRTAETLGAEREGSGIVIDEKGLVLTMGYLMVEAYAAEVTTSSGETVAAEVVGYDHATGFGLLRATAPLKAKPMSLGRSAEVKERDPVLIASFGGAQMVAPAYVVARREFAGSWEYLLDEAIFTAPPHPAWSGAALISRDGKLVGVGSLIVANATGTSEGVAGNMFVPIDGLPPILADLIATGRSRQPARPWLGLTTEELGGKLVVARVSAGGPAERAGVRQGDLVVGVGGAAAENLADFYRKVWAKGSAGVTVPLDLLRENQVRRFEVQSMDRYDHLKLDPTL